MLRRLLGSAVAVLILSVASCGGGAPNTADPAAPIAVGAEALHYRLDGFALSVSRDSLAYGGSFDQVLLKRNTTPGGVELSVEVQGARQLKALYFELEYDAQKYSPQSAAATETLSRGGGATSPPVSGDRQGAPPTNILELAVLTEPGTVHHGQVVVHPEGALGVSGNLMLATITFAQGPATPVRAASTAPITDLSRSTANYVLGTNKLTWNYASQGDYDQNSLVSISDLTPLATHFGSSASPAFPEDVIEHQVDGDNNGLISISDITPIGSNFGRLASEYHVYKGTDVSDVPRTNTEPSVGTPIAIVPFSTAIGSPNTEPLTFEYTPAVPEDDAVYWVRPSDGISEGTPSRPDGGNVVLLTPETTILGPETGIEFIERLDSSTMQLTDPPGGGADVEPGQILVGVYEDIALGEFHGVMDRVQSIDSRVGDLVTVTTEPASFSDVFQQAGFSKTADLLNPGLLDLVTKYPCAPTATTVREIGKDGKPITPISGGGFQPPTAAKMPPPQERFRTISADSARALEAKRLNARRTSAESDISLDFSGARLLDKTEGSNYLRVYVEQGTFDWNLPGVDVDYDVGVDWCWYVIPCGISLHHFKAGVSGGVASDLVVKAEGHWEGALAEEAKLYELTDYYVFAIGPVPVVMRVTVAIYGGVTGNAHADLFAKAGYHMNYGLAMGVQYAPATGWGTYFEPEANFTPEPPEMNANGSADLFAYLRGEVTIAFYDVAGGRVSLTPGLQGHADGSIDIPAGEYCLNWSLDGRLRGDLNLYAQIFGISLFDESWNIFDISSPITNGTIGCGGPSSSPPNMYFNGTTGVGFLPHTVMYTAGDESLNPGSDTFDPDSFTNDGPGLKQGIKQYFWDLDGDGFCEQMTMGDMPMAHHTYNAYGDYNVSLWAVDDDGMIVQKTILANIQEPPF